MRPTLFAALALTLAGGATFATTGLLGRFQEPAAAPNVVETAPAATKAVLVAAEDLAAGTFVKPESLRWQEWPDVAVPESYGVRGAVAEGDLVGSVVRRPLFAGEPIQSTYLVKSGDRGFLAAVLDPGMRAMSIAVDETSSSAGLIFPGDRVDVIVTHQLRIPGEAVGERRVSETVLEDVRVLAMGARLNGASDAEKEGDSARTATLGGAAPRQRPPPSPPRRRLVARRW